MGKLYRTYSRSLIGISHIRSNIVCQDNSLNATINGVSIAIVSDGCGSAKYSDQASILICNGLIKKIADEFDDLVELDPKEAKEKINSYVFDMISSYAKLRELKVEELLATYVFAAVKNDTWLFVRCGDGGIITRTINGDVEVFSERKVGYANETIYFQSKRVLEDMDVIITKNPDIIQSMVFTDGVEDLIYNEDRTLNNNLILAMKNNGTDDREKLNQYLEELLTVIRDETDDDCSYALISLDNEEVKSEIVRLKEIISLEDEFDDDLKESLGDDPLDYISDILEDELNQIYIDWTSYIDNVMEDLKREDNTIDQNIEADITGSKEEEKPEASEIDSFVELEKGEQ